MEAMKKKGLERFVILLVLVSNTKNYSAVVYLQTLRWFHYTHSPITGGGSLRYGLKVPEMLVRTIIK